jgi:hypothetical protein
MVIGRADFGPLLHAAAQGSQAARATLSPINDWLGHLGRAKRGRGPLCLGCSAEFSKRVTPESFVVTRPFANDTVCAVSGLCRRCTARADLEAAIVGWLREIFPALNVVRGGEA